MDWLKEARRLQPEMVNDLKTLVDIPSLLDESTATDQAPFGEKVRAALDQALAIGQRDGFVTTDYQGYAGVIEYGNGPESVGMIGHLDVVPVSDKWSKDPFKSKVEKGILFGRGAADDKGPTLAAYYALRILRDLQVPLRKKIELIMGCDEKSGMRGILYYKEHAKVPQCGFVPDATFPVVYAEKGILDLKLSGPIQSVIKYFAGGQRPNIVIPEATAVVAGAFKQELFEFYLRAHGLKGCGQATAEGAEYRIEGVGAHGARPYLGVNAAWHLFAFIAGAYEDEFAANTAYLMEDWLGGKLNTRYEGAYLGFLTVNLGIVKITEASAEFTLDIRYPNDIDKEQIIANINSALRKRAYPLTITVSSDKAPLFVDPENPLIKTLVGAYRKISHDEYTPLRTMRGGTYARNFDNFVAFGPGFPNRPLPAGVGIAHADDEGVEIEALVLATAVYAEALWQLCR